jgi:hypothetical protein
MLDLTPFGVAYEGWPMRGGLRGVDSEGWLTVVINPLAGVLLRPHVDPARRVGCCRPDGSAGLI